MPQSAPHPYPDDHPPDHGASDADAATARTGSEPPAQEHRYAVGYGKPPLGSRFQPGRSGNPKGRPRGDMAFKTLLGRELAERVAVKEQGRRRKLSKRGVIVKRLVSEAMAGNPKHLAIVLAQDPIAAEILEDVTAALARPADALVKAELIERLRRATGWDTAAAAASASEDEEDGA